MDLGVGVQWLFYFVKSYRSLRKYSFIIREMNEPVMAFRGKTFHNQLNQSSWACHSFSKKFRLYTLKLIHVLMANSRCYGRCYVKILIPLCTFLQFHTHLEENLARSFQNVFDKCSRVLNLVFSRN